MREDTFPNEIFQRCAHIGCLISAVAAARQMPFFKASRFVFAAPELLP
jgi:hypothetical protein